MLIRQACCFKRPDIMYFIRILLNLCETYDIKYTIHYVPSKLNKADAISRMVPLQQFQNNTSNKLEYTKSKINHILYTYLSKY